jgi:alkanesulfonate monooxygenase SsuD/methylene tetrahydromethanopterin reductase-like flavin-dependent oxidoreductase (luciferase family)
MTSTEASQTAAGFAERDLTVHETRVRVLSAGAGDPFLYLHDSGDLGQWAPWLSGLAGRYAVWRPDHPGFNASADGADIDSVHELAFFYLDLMDELGLDRVILAGAGLGGWLAADLATIEPQRVSIDPRRGHELYQRYLAELVLYDEVGFDGVCVNEHHQTAYGLMPAPDVVAAVLVPQTRGKIAVLGNATSLRDHPLRAARNRYTYLQTYSDIATLRRAFTEYREAAERHGYPAAPARLGWAAPVYLADTDEQARREAAPHLDFLFNTLLRMPRDMFFPPGYLTMASAPRVLGAKRGLGTGRNDLAELIERGYALVGSPATVRQQLEQYASELGFGIFCGICQFGSLGHEEFERSVRLFADGVMPALRPAGSDRT